jgi:hypothetical protein
MHNQYRTTCNKTLLYIIYGSIIFFVFILPMIDSCNQQDNIELTERLENLNYKQVKYDTASDVNNDKLSTSEDNKGITKLDTNVCSKQCCKHTQWPPSIGEIEGDIKKEDLDKYIGSNLSCNFGTGSGCLCITKDDFNYLSNRGQTPQNITKQN